MTLTIEERTRRESYIKSFEEIKANPSLWVDKFVVTFEGGKYLKTTWMNAEECRFSCTYDLDSDCLYEPKKVETYEKIAKTLFGNGKLCTVKFHVHLYLVKFADGHSGFPPEHEFPLKRRHLFCSKEEVWRVNENSTHIRYPLAWYRQT